MHFHITLVCLLVGLDLSLQEGLTDDEIAQIVARGYSGRCGSYVNAARVQRGINITVNGLPDHQFSCVNPNTPTESWMTYQLPDNPSFSANGPYSLPPGPIGLAINGVAFFNPLTAEGYNAVAGETEEMFDCCYGHSTERGNYHYHKWPCSTSCDNPVCDGNSRSSPQFIGVAFDGFPIYSEWDGLNLNSMDQCHGTTLPDGRYAYIAVENHFPYIMGCYQGEPNFRNPTECSGAGIGKLCDSRWGTKTEAEVTTTTNVGRKTSNHGEQEFVAELLGYMLARSQHDSRQTSSRTKRATLDECYSTTCNESDNSSYENGQCTGGPGFGRPSNNNPGGGRPSKNRPPKRRPTSGQMPPPGQRPPPRW